MRAVALSVWIFINLAFLGMGGYLYLILSTYWCRETRNSHIQPMLHKKIKFSRENQVVFYEPLEESAEHKTKSEVEESEDVKDGKVFLKKLSRSRRRSSFKKCSNDTCTIFSQLKENKLEKFKNKLLIQLRTVLHEESNVFKIDNPYFVNYTGSKGKYRGLTSNEVKCKLKEANLRLLKNTDPPFSFSKYEKIIGKEEFLDGKHFKSCAIVSSAGSLLNSSLGPLIDEHEIVVRFNHAPTKNFENDVGAKTTIRLVNSQVVSKEEFKFTVSPLYKNVTLVVWDPSNYSSTLQEWYNKPDFNFFETWAKQKLLNSKKNSFILDPRSVWRVWDFIQHLTSLRIRKNPPSSGFLGLTLLLPYCDYVDFFEFVPSFRITKKCHYFDDFDDNSCTFGVWHPLSAEKLVSLILNEANDTTVFDSGFIRIQGYRHLKC